MQNTINLVFHKINIQIESQITEFIQFVAGYFSENISQEKISGYDILVSFAILSKKEYDDINMRYTNAENFSQFSRSVYYSLPSVLLTDMPHLPGLKLTFKLEENILKVSGYYCDDRNLRDTLAKYLYRASRNLKLFLYLKYYLILYPVIWYHETFKNRYLIHASGLVYKEKTILIPGLGGVGKSTFVISLLSNPAFKFISDNLVLYGDDEVISINEAIALDEKSLTLCANSRDQLRPLNIAMSHDRRYFRVDQLSVAVGKVQSVFFVKFNYKTEVTKLNKEQAKDKIELINNIAKEVQEYTSIASAVNMSLGFVNSSARSETISDLINRAECYDLSIRPNENLSVVQKIMLDYLL